MSTLLRTIVAVILLTLTALAQHSDGNYWSEYPRPANTTSFRSIGTLALIETPTEFHCYSGLHRTWTVHPVVAPTVLGVTNSYCLWRDGTTVYGFSTRSGRVAALPTSGNITVDIGTATSSWTAYVLDGDTVWGWSGFFGEWKPLPVRTAPTLQLGSHMLMSRDGERIGAFSAFFGEWVTIPDTAANVFTWRNGCVATFQDPDYVRAFSAYRNEWVTSPSFRTAGVGFDGRDGYASLSANGGEDVLWFSALRGEFAISHDPAPVVLRYGPNCAVIESPNGLTGYSPGSGSLVPIPTAVAAPAVTLAGSSFGAYALVDDGAMLQAFSGLTGNTVTSPTYATFAYSLGDTCAFATGPAGLHYAYSALRDEWVQAPATAATDVRPDFECILRVLPGAYEAYSARTGQFATLPVTSPGVVSMLTQGAIIGIVGTDGIDVFDPRYTRWEHQATGPSPSFGVHRLVGIGRDAANGYGYSLFTNTWQQVPLQGTVQTSAANSSIGYIATDSHYYVFTGNGSLTNFSRFPEFSRFAVLGVPLPHLQAGNPGAFVVGLFSTTQAELATPFGTLRVDPSAIAIPLGFVPAHGLLRSSIPTPNVPALRGVTLFMQDVLLRPNGTIALSNGQAPYLW